VTRRLTAYVVCATILLLLAGCVGSLSSPKIELVAAPTEGFSRTKLAMVWEITPPKSFSSATQFTLHLDEYSHSGRIKSGIGPMESSYSTTVEAEPEVLDSGGIRLSFPLYESKPTLLYYRLHVNIDGRHYWTPEGMLNIKHKPALTEEFKESYLSESVNDLRVLS